MLTFDLIKYLNYYQIIKVKDQDKFSILISIMLK